jgi:hypothetical protein
LKLKPIHFILFWTILNLLQAGFTELTSDEGYYWFYSTSLQWGYYDHPPFLAWIVRLGYSIFHNELGVRIINVLMSSAGLWLFFNWLPQEWKEKKAVYLLLLAAPLANYLSFIIFPDGPLLFFSMVFLTLYKRFLSSQDWGTASLIGLAAACMLYSKYHAVLVICFTVLSNFKLLKSKYFYAAAGVMTVLMVPHFMWQRSEGYPSLAFHLSGRISSFSTKHVFEYVSQQVFAIGPSLIFIPFVTKVKDQFEKTLLYIIAGTFLFFLFSSFKTFVHFHWTSIAVFPLLYFATKYFSTQKKQKLLLWLTTPFIVLLFIFRIQLMVEVFPFTHLNVDYYHGRKIWAKEMAAVADGRPVAFVDNFREAGLYTFYSGQMAVTLSSGETRKTQYDTWHYDDSLQHKKVLLLQYHSFEGSRELLSSLGKKYYLADVDDFCTYYNLPVKVIRLNKRANNIAYLTLEITNSRSSTLSFAKDAQGNYPILFYSTLNKGAENFIKRDTLRVMTEADTMSAGSSKQFNLSITLPTGIHPEHIAFGFQYGILPDSYNCFWKW